MPVQNPATASVQGQDIEAVISEGKDDAAVLTLKEGADIVVDLGEDAHSNGGYLSVADSSDEVEEWLSRFLPRLREEDAVKYLNYLNEEGFDSLERLSFVAEEDLSFMKTGHR